MLKTLSAAVVTVAVIVSCYAMAASGSFSAPDCHDVATQASNPSFCAFEAHKGLR